MATFSLTSSAAMTSSASAQLVKVRLAIQTTCPFVAAPAAWMYMLNTSGDITVGYPYFDVPSGWPTPQLPGP